MLKITGGFFIIAAAILGQIVMYNMTEKYLPQYLQMYVIAIVFSWIGLVIKTVSD